MVHFYDFGQIHFLCVMWVYLQKQIDFIFLVLWFFPWTPINDSMNNVWILSENVWFCYDAHLSLFFKWIEIQGIRIFLMQTLKITFILMIKFYPSPMSLWISWNGNYIYSLIYIVLLWVFLENFISKPVHFYLEKWFFKMFCHATGQRSRHSNSCYDRWTGR